MDWRLFFTLLSSFCGFLLVFVISFTMLSSSGPGAGNVFTYHPILMSFGFILLNSGTLSYYSKCEEDLSPKLHLQKQRFLHANIQILGSVSILIGIVCIWISHAKKGQSQFGLESTLIKKAHVWLGWSIVLLLCLQVIVGALKYSKPEVKFAKWHGKLGKVILLFGLLNINIAIFFWSWSLNLKAFLIFLLTLLIGSTILVFSIGRDARMLKMPIADSKVV